MTCWRTPRRLRGENGARVTSAFQTRGQAWLGARGDSGSSRHDGRHSDRGSDVPQGAAERRSRSRGLNVGCTPQGVRFVELPVGSGTGQAVPAAMTRDVRDRCCAR